MPVSCRTPKRQARPRPSRRGRGSGRPQTGRNGAGCSGARHGDDTPKRTRNRVLGARRSAAKRPQLDNAGGDPRKSWPPGAARRDGEVARGSAQASPINRSRGVIPTPQSSGLTGRPHRPELCGVKRRLGGLQGRRIAGLINRTRRRGRVVVYATPGCFAHPKTRAFWLGSASGGPRSQTRDGPLALRSGVGQTRKRVCENVEYTHSLK